MNDLRNFQENQDKIMRRYQSKENPKPSPPKSDNFALNPAFSFTSTSIKMNDPNIKRRKNQI